MKLLFILDPLASLNIAKDTSVAMMQEAAQRGYQLFVCAQHDLFLRMQTVKINVQVFTFVKDKDWYKTGPTTEMYPVEFDAILMRKNPPFDNEYLYSTHLLDLAVQQNARVFNHPTAIRGWNEKLSIAKFPQFTTAFIVTNNHHLIREFLAQHKDIILKPLDGMGGISIFRLNAFDPNISVILETITDFGKQTIMVQCLIPAIKQGDKRIIVIDGAPIPYALVRIPKKGETRANLAAGGKAKVQPLSTRDIEIASDIGKTLKAEGLTLVGLDIIGDYLSEINVTSPTGMLEIAAQTDCQPAAIFIDAIENLTN